MSLQISSTRRRPHHIAARALIASAVLLAGAVGLGACQDDEAPADDSRQSMGESIKDFDFANATIRGKDGKDVVFKDGFSGVPGYEGTDVGWHIAEGPEYADADGDNDLDAAIIYTWIAAAGAPSHTAYLWTWEDGTATQVEHPILAGNDGAISDLTATKDGFTITTVSRPFLAPESEADGEAETFTIGVTDGYPAQIAPTFGAVDRCVEHPDDPPGAVGLGPAPRLAPHEDAPRIGEESDFANIYTIASMWNTDEWVLARAERADGSISCGWLRYDEAGQG